MSGFFLTKSPICQDDLEIVQRALVVREGNRAKVIQHGNWCLVTSIHSEHPFQEPHVEQTESTLGFVWGSLFTGSRRLESADIARQPMSDDCNWEGAGFALRLTEQGAAQFRTDAMGFVPIFRSGDSISSDPDLLGLFNRGNVSTLAIAQTVFFSRTPMPKTYWEHVHVLPPANLFEWEQGKLRSNCYWEPNASVTSNKHQLIEQTVEGVRSAVRRRESAANGNVTLLLSAGLDSRAILYSLANPAAARCLTLADTENEEVRLSREIANSAGAKHVVMFRDVEHYPRESAGQVQSFYGMWNFADLHTAGLGQKILEDSPGIVMTGCYADYLFKGIEVDRRSRTVMGRFVPWYAVRSTSAQGYCPHAFTDAPKFQMVFERSFHDVQQQFGSVDELSLKQNEIRRIWPIFMEPNLAFRTGLRRYLPWEPVFADTALLDVWDHTPRRWAINGEIWSKAVAKMSPVGCRIKNNNWSGRVGASAPENAVRHVAGSIFRKFQKLKQEMLPAHATIGSWPNYAVVLEQSSRFHQDWNAISAATKELVAEATGQDYWSQDLSHWIRRDALALMRVFTIARWHDGIEQRRREWRGKVAA